MSKKSSGTVPGFDRIGRIDRTGEKSLWVRREPERVILRAGKNGNDHLVILTKDNPQYKDLRDLFSKAIFYALSENEEGLGSDLDNYDYANNSNEKEPVGLQDLMDRFANDIQKELVP